MKEDTWRKEYGSKICKECGRAFYRGKMQRANHFTKLVTCSRTCFGKYANKKLCAGIRKKFDSRECRMCRQMFQPVNQTHSYCGSKIRKEGCSWKHYLQVRNRKNSLHRMYGSRKFWLNTTKGFVR